MMGEAPFPAYTSGHATFGAAMFRTLAQFYGRDDVTFSFTSDECNGVTRDQDGSLRPLVTRTYHSFSAAAEENGQSRIYLGIHWHFDKVQGIAAANALADYVYANWLRPCSHDHGGKTLPGAPADQAAAAAQPTDAGLFLALPSDGPTTPLAAPPDTASTARQQVTAAVAGAPPQVLGSAADRLPVAARKRGAARTELELLAPDVFDPLSRPV